VNEDIADYIDWCMESVRIKLNAGMGEAAESEYELARVNILMYDASIVFPAFPRRRT